MDYLLLKWIHILSSTILFGTGIGSAFFFFMANRRGEVASIYFVVRHVVIADWLFTMPAVLIQFVTGLWLVHTLGYHLKDGWILSAIALYLLTGACWIPVVLLQIKMRDLAKEAVDTGDALPAGYWRMNRWWVMLGSLAFPTVMVIFYMMVFKPSL